MTSGLGIAYASAAELAEAFRSKALSSTRDGTETAFLPRGPE